MMGFVDHHTDADTVEYLSKSVAPEILEKAMDKTKLVQKDVQYKTKTGMKTRKQWVKAHEDEPANKQAKHQDDEEEKQKKPQQQQSDKKLSGDEAKWGEGCLKYQSNQMTDSQLKQSRPNFPWPDRINATDEEKAFADKAVKEYEAKKEYSAPSDYVKKYKGVSPEGYCSIKKASLPKNTPEDVREIYDRAVDAEPQITKVINKVAEETGMKLFGSDFRIKEGDSFLRKIRKTAQNTEHTEAEAAEANTDTIRYTAITQPDDMVTDYNKTVRALQDAGNKLVFVHNNFTDKNWAFNCLECVFENPSGQKFELWFHTPETKHVQDNGGHKYYEALRVMDNPSDAQKCERAVYEMYYKCQIPDGIESIKTTKYKEG